jgi:pimeloyl-ACP methyl ester carboxylesterase
MKSITTTLLLLLILTIVSQYSYSQTVQTTENMKNISSKTVLFIHGAFVSSQCWDEWKDYFKEQGYTVYAPAWPHKDAIARTLRSRQPDSAVASIRLKELVDYYDSIIQRLPEKPILIGHSLGGLIVQLLLQRDRAAAGIAIHSVAPKGTMTLKLSFLRSTSAALGLFTSTKKSYLMSFKKWQYAFTNGMTLIQQQDGYEKYAVPESKLALRDGLTSVAKVDYKKLHAPLLFTSGSIDHCVPASLNRDNFKKYKKHGEGSITELKEFEGRNHFVLGQPTWKEDADFILRWISHHTAQSVAHPITSATSIK